MRTSRESGVKSRESGVRSQKSKVGSRELRVMSGFFQFLAFSKFVVPINSNRSRRDAIGTTSPEGCSPGVLWTFGITNNQDGQPGIKKNI